jgi:anti-sigma factor RsiW
MRRDEELMTAYVDGVAELTADERRRVEGLLALTPDLRADADATRDLLADLRAMPQPGNEPDWTVLERSIRTAVADEAPPRRWLRWFLPALTCVAAAAIALIVLLPGRQADPIAHETTPAPAPTRVEPVVESHTFVYLDGEAIDLGEADAAKALEALEEEEPDEDGSGALLATPDLDWVDKLDGDRLARAEKLLQGS